MSRMNGLIDRRRASRPTLDSRATMQMELQTWINMRSGWNAVRTHARTSGYWECMARAEAKMVDCDIQIQRVRSLLNLPERRRKVRSDRAWLRA